jgi:hypothetical protein
MLASARACSVDGDRLLAGVGCNIVLNVRARAFLERACPGDSELRLQRGSKTPCRSRSSERRRAEIATARKFRGRRRPRVPHSGLLPGFSVVDENDRKFLYEFKIVRFSKIGSDPIFAAEAAWRVANESQDRPRSAWIRIAIPIANSGFPSVFMPFELTQIGVYR